MIISTEKNNIETERLTIEYINKVYINEIFNEKNNPEVNNYLSSISATSIEDLRKRIETTIGKNGKEDIAQFQVINKENREFIGLCILKKINTVHPEIGLRIKQGAWGKGYGQEITSALIYRTKNYLNYEYIVYETFEDNIGSVKIIESLGGVKNSEYNKIKINYYGKPLKHLQYRIY